MKKTMLAAILLTGFLHETARAEINIDQLLQRESRELEAYRKAAEQGDAKAQYNLGWMYGNGQGVPQDYQRAYAWFLKAAEQGDASAQFNLGVIYGNGQGVELDFKQAYAWFSVAAVNGVGQAVEWRDRAASKLTPTALAEAQALASRYFDQSQPK
jgi:hypothetical protein